MKKLVVLLVLLAGLWQGAVVKAANYDTAWVRQTQDIFSISFHPSSQFFAVGGSYASIWDVNTATELKKYTGYACNTVCFSESGKYLIQKSDTAFRILDFSMDSVVFKNNNYTQHYYTAISPDERFIAAGQSDCFTVWDIVTGKEVKHVDSIVDYKSYENVAGTGPFVIDLKFSKDGRYLAIAMAAGDTVLVGKLFLINLATYSIDFEYPIGAYGHIEYSHDGTKIAYTSPDSGEAIKVMDVNTKQIVAIIPGVPKYGASEGVSQIRFSKDDSLLIMAYSTTIEVFDLTHSKILKSYTTVPPGYLLKYCDISSDEKYIAGNSGSYLFLYNFDKNTSVIEGNTIKATLIYPNPADNALINLTFDLEKPNLTSINLYDLQGKTVKVIENRYLPEGHYLYPVDVSNILNGSYFLKITSGNFSFSQSIIVNK